VRRKRSEPPAQTLAAWRLTLGAGAVVALVVCALLEWLRRTVNHVDEAVADVWTAGQRLAQNTQALHLLQTTHARSADLADEMPAPEEV
jgi:hypothetical protein